MKTERILIFGLGTMAIICIAGIVYSCITKDRDVVYDESEDYYDREDAMRNVDDQEFYVNVLHGKGPKLPSSLIAEAAECIKDENILIAYIRQNRQGAHEILEAIMYRINNRDILAEIAKNPDYLTSVRIAALSSAKGNASKQQKKAVSELAIKIAKEEDKETRLAVIHFLKEWGYSRTFLNSVFSNQKEKDMDIRLAAAVEPVYPNEYKFLYSMVKNEKWQLPVRIVALRTLVFRDWTDYCLQHNCREKLIALARKSGVNEALRLVIMSYYFSAYDLIPYTADKNELIGQGALNLLVKHNEIRSP